MVLRIGTDCSVRFFVAILSCRGASSRLDGMSWGTLRWEREGTPHTHGLTPARQVRIADFSFTSPPPPAHGITPYYYYFREALSYRWRGCEDTP